MALIEHHYAILTIFKIKKLNLNIRLEYNTGINYIEYITSI